MPRKTNLLAVKAIENPKLAPGRYADGDGLYLVAEAAKSGGPVTRRRWMFFYQSPTQRRRREAGFGSFPEVGLAAARGLREAWRAKVAAGVDPIEERAAEQAQRNADAERAQAAAQAAAETFGVVADAYFAVKSPGWSETHRRDVARILAELKTGGPADPNVTPRAKGLADVPMMALRKPAIREVLDAIVARGALTYVRDVLMYCRIVVDFYNAGRDEPITDPTQGLLKKLPDAPRARHHPALDPADMPAYLRALHASRADALTKAAHRLIALTGLRTKELRGTRWDEFDTEAAVWMVPSERMKYHKYCQEPHFVPLSRQALAVLEELRSLTGHGPFVFPGKRRGVKTISENTMLKAIDAIGYRGRMTVHGYRAVFSSTMNERGFHRDAVELQMAHVSKDAVRRAYMRAKFKDERMRLMQAWADQLDAWEHGAKVLPLRAAG